MKKKIVILHLAHWDQLLGGAELQLKYFAEFLVRQNYECHFVFALRNEIKINSSNINLHLLKSKFSVGILGKSWFLHKKNINKILSDIEPEIIITRAYSSFPGIAAQFALKQGVKHLHFVASDNEILREENGVSLYKPFNRIELKYNLKIYNSNTTVCSQNLLQKEYIKNRFGVNSKIINQSTPISNLDDIIKSKNEIKIIWIANLKPLKRPEKFIKIAHYFRKHKNIVFEMIGGDNMNKYDNILKEAQSYGNFNYLGQLNNDDVNRLLNQSHILLNTSDYEGFSNTFLQAWIRKNIVLSLNSNPSEILTKNNIGFLTGSVDASIQKINYLSSNMHVLKEMGESARDYVLKYHDQEKIFNNLISFDFEKDFN